ncbi:MAG: glycosyltransferase family 2 protein [Candidatus Cloacimonetes bacterium]|nr:glycosyltransferase family 2 protein [Candidatus Cloacimonadota bacterium]
MTNPKPRVSVIMRSKNSDWVIAQALAGLYSQTYKDFELLVVDSGSTDRTLEIVKQYPCRLIQIEAKSYYPGSVLNMAIEQAEADIIVFQNSDGVPLSPHTLQRLVNAFDDAAVDAALTRQIPRPEAFDWVRRDYRLSFPDAEQTPDWIRLSLPMAAMRRAAWEKHHFYTTAWASEDTEWGEWAVQNDMQIKYVPDAIIMHSHNYTLKQIYGRKFVEGEADAFIYNRKPSLGKMITGICKQTLRDSLYLLFKGNLAEAFGSLSRNITYNKAYYKGIVLGSQRKINGDNDTSIGQNNVLSRYEK